MVDAVESSKKVFCRHEAKTARCTREIDRNGEGMREIRDEIRKQKRVIENPRRIVCVCV